MELTSHQSDVGAVLEFGNQLISEGLVNEKEENEIRDQMISLNDRWEALRMAAMDRQTKYVSKWKGLEIWFGDKNKKKNGIKINISIQGGFRANGNKNEHNMGENPN